MRGRTILVLAASAHAASAALITHPVLRMTSHLRAASPVCVLDVDEKKPPAFKVKNVNLEVVTTREPSLEQAVGQPVDEVQMSTRMEGGLLMLVVALLWGSNFPAVKAVMDAGLPGSAAAAMRFSVAAAALFPMLGRAKDGLPLDLVLGGLECGVWLALGYIGQVPSSHAPSHMRLPRAHTD